MVLHGDVGRVGPVLRGTVGRTGAAIFAAWTRAGQPDGARGRHPAADAGCLAGGGNARGGAVGRRPWLRRRRSLGAAPWRRPGSALGPRRAPGRGRPLPDSATLAAGDLRRAAAVLCLPVLRLRAAAGAGDAAGAGLPCRHPVLCGGTAGSARRCLQLPDAARSGLGAGGRLRPRPVRAASGAVRPPRPLPCAVRLWRAIRGGDSAGAPVSRHSDDRRSPACCRTSRRDRGRGCPMTFSRPPGAHGRAAR